MDPVIDARLRSLDMSHPINRQVVAEYIVGQEQVRAAYIAAGMDPDGTPADHLAAMLAQMAKEQS